MCKSAGCCHTTTTGTGALAAGGVVLGAAGISALAAILTDIIDALAITAAVTVPAFVVFLAWRVRVLTRAAAPATRSLPAGKPPARELPHRPSRAIEAPGTVHNHLHLHGVTAADLATVLQHRPSAIHTITED